MLSEGTAMGRDWIRGTRFNSPNWNTSEVVDCLNCSAKVHPVFPVKSAELICAPS